jgi:hypothetical protein
MPITPKTHSDLGSSFGSVSGRGIYISFQWDMITLNTSDPERAGKRERRLRLMKQPVGDPSSCSSSYITEQQAKEKFPAEWEYFSKYSEMPTTGTPLSELPGVSQSQIQIMNLSGLRSIEDVLGVSEEVINRVGHEGRFVLNVAKEWKKRATEHGDMIDFAEQTAAFDQRLKAETQARMNAEAQNNELMARLKALEGLLSQNGNIPTPVQPGAGNDPVAVQGDDPALEDTNNPLADGDGTMDDDPLQ